MEICSPIEEFCSYETEMLLVHETFKKFQQSDFLCKHESAELGRVDTDEPAYDLF